jgi:hypothetical protein
MYKAAPSFSDAKNPWWVECRYYIGIHEHDFNLKKFDNAKDRKVLWIDIASLASLIKLTGLELDLPGLVNIDAISALNKLIDKTYSR